MTDARAPRSQGGFALIGALGMLIVLSILGVVVYRNVNTDITHTGRDMARVRAEFAAESAVQWGLAEVARKRPGSAPFTLRTHGPDGEEAIEGDPHNEEGARLKLTSGDVDRMPGARGGIDGDGWVFGTSSGRENSVSYAKSETLAFKVWYPNDSTLRIQGRGEVDGTVADVDLVSTIRVIAVPLP